MNSSYTDPSFGDQYQVALTVILIPTLNAEIEKHIRQINKLEDRFISKSVNALLAVRSVVIPINSQKILMRILMAVYSEKSRTT